MSSHQNIFQRYEKKYLLTEQQYTLLRQKLEGHLKSDRFSQSTICNIYFDTPNYQLIRSSLEKPVYKEKLRLRSYGVPSSSDTVFIELKKKYKGVVYKRRVDMSLKDAMNYLYDQKPIQNPSQIIREINWSISHYPNIAPSMYISYDRTALYGVEDPNLRITFDSNILWRKDKLQLNEGIWGDTLLKTGQRLMEIKIPNAMPLWLSHILDELYIYPTSFSKYGIAFQQLLKDATLTKGVIICA